MHKLTKTLVSLLLCLCLCLNTGGSVFAGAANVLTLRASAEELLGAEPTAEEMKKALDTINGAMEALNLEGKSGFMQAFTTFMDVANYIGITFVAINGTITFLRLIGLIDDPTVSGIKSILEAMERVEGKLQEIDQKLDNLTSEMLKLEASTEFYARGLSAQGYETTWRGFYSENVTNILTGTNSLMSQYNTMLKAGVQRWCENIEAGDRKTRKIDNTQLVLLYDRNKEGKLVLTPSLENGVPAAYQEYKAQGNTDHAYLVLSSDCLPQTMDYNVDTVAKDIPAAIKAGILENVEELDSWNLTLDEAAITQAAEDAYVLLNHRVAAAQLQTSQYEQLANNIINSFKKYCSTALEARNGLDAMYQSLILTHGFEGEISESIEQVTNHLIALTGIYGPFVASVMSQSTTVDAATKASVMSAWVDTVNQLKERMRNTLTGYPQYSYVLGGIVTPVKLEQEISLWTEYEFYKGRFDHRGTNTFTMKEAGSGEDDTLPMVDNEKFALLNLYFQHSGSEPGADSFKKYLTQGKSTGWFDSDDTIIVNATKPISYNTASTYVSDMYVGIGVTNSYWWKDGSITDLRNLPSKATRSYINNNQMIQGTVYDMKTGAIRQNEVVMAAAIYGEGHGYWSVDEVYLFAKKLDNVERTVKEISGTEKRTTLRSWGDRCGIRVDTVDDVPVMGVFSSLNTYAETVEEIEKNLPAPQPEPVYGAISGTVYNGYLTLHGADIRLYRDGKQVASCATLENGDYLFDGLEPGTYEVEASYGTKQRRTVTVGAGEGLDVRFFYNCNIRSENILAPFDVITAQSLPGGLTLKTDWYVEKEGSALSAIRAAGGTAKYELMELSLLNADGEQVHETADPVTIVIPYNVTRKDYSVLRYHEGKVDRLTAAPNADGEYMEVGEDSITIHANRFSVYAITYDRKADPVKPEEEQDSPAPVVRPTSPKTGDSSNVVVLLAMLGACALLTAAGAKRRE